MKLETINYWLRKIGLVLVVCVDDGTGDEPTILRIERASTYDRRLKQQSQA